MGDRVSHPRGAQVEVLGASTKRCLDVAETIGIHTVRALTQALLRSGQGP